MLVQAPSAAIAAIAAILECTRCWAGVICTTVGSMEQSGVVPSSTVVTSFIGVCMSTFFRVSVFGLTVCGG